MKMRTVMNVMLVVRVVTQAEAAAPSPDHPIILEFRGNFLIDQGDMKGALDIAKKQHQVRGMLTSQCSQAND